MKKYTIKYGNIPVTKQKVCCKITGTVHKTIIKKWNISDEIIVEVYRYMENELFEKAPVHKAYFNMALPLVFSMVISLVYNMVDTFFIVRTGNTNLVAGVSLGAPMFTAMIALGDIFGLGGSSVIARLFGQRKDEDAKRISSFCFYGAIICGVIVTVLLLIFRAPMLHLLGADANTYKYASQYYTYLVLGSVFVIVSFTPNNQLRSEGFSKASMEGSVLGAVVNIILDPIFISVLGMGAGGAAIATIIGYIATDAYYVWIYLKKSKKLSIDPGHMHINMQEFRQILAIGIPASITNFMQSFAVAVTNRGLLVYGNNKVAAMGIVMKVNMIAALILVGFAFGCQPLVGYNYGARNKKRLKEILAFCYKFECGLAVILAVILFAGARPLIRVFMKTPEIVDSGVLMLRLQQAGMMFMAVVLVTTCVFQSAGKAMGAFLLSVSRQGVIYGIVIVIASHMIGYHGVLAAQAVSDFLTALMAAILLKHELWSELTDIKRNEEAV